MDIQSNGTHVTLYDYVPSNVAAYIFTALFGLSTLAHFIYMIPLRAAYFIPFLIGGICTFYFALPTPLVMHSNSPLIKNP